MTSGSVTLKQVAMAAGVHPSTVSRALDPSRRHLIAEDVASSIETVAAQLGYRRNLGAAALRTGRSRMVGVIVPDIANPVFGSILGGVEAALAKQGYSAIVANAASGGRRALDAARELIDRRVDGLVLATAELHDEVVNLCLAERIPLVLVNRAEIAPRVPTIISDDKAGIRMSVEHLIALGHKQIGHLAGPQTVSTGLWRLEGFSIAMDHAGLDPTAVVVATAYTRGAGRTAAEQLLRSHAVTAIATGNDLLALGAYSAISDVGLRCPEDISVVGYNDMPLIDIVSPPLTSIRINSFEMGRLSGERLACVMNRQADSTLVMVEPEIVLRHSTARLPILS